MHTEILTPATHAEWDAFVRARPDSSCYHLAGWQTVGERAYRMRSPFLLARAMTTGPIVGVLPLFVVRNPSGGLLTSGLFGAYGPMLAADRAVADALLDHATRLAAAARVGHILLKGVDGDPLEPQAPAWERRDISVTATMPLPADPQALWKKLRDKSRNAVRKAERFKLELKTGGEFLDDLYDILAENLHRLGTPPYGKPFLRELYDALGPQTLEIVTLHHEGRAISAALLACHGTTAYVPFASSRPDTFSMNPNNLLYWHLLQRAIARGMTVFDFGRSRRNTSTLNFKTGWGATLSGVPFFLQAVRGKLPDLDSESPAVQRLIRLWQRLPRPVVDRIGPAICQRFLTI